MKSNRPPCNSQPRVNVSLQVSPAYAAELDQLARRHGTNRHKLLLMFIKEGVERLASDTTASQQQG